MCQGGHGPLPAFGMTNEPLLSARSSRRKACRSFGGGLLLVSRSPRQPRLLMCEQLTVQPVVLVDES